MASIMRYVVNNLNQLPSYCFAEESLMPENCCKATLTEEKNEVPLVSSGPTPPHYDNQYQQQSVRPPPGFLPLGEQRVPSNASAKSFQNSYSFASTSNATTASNTKTSVFGDAEATSNPFLVDQQFIPNDVAKQMYMLIWNENKKLQLGVTEILYDLLDHSSLSFNDQIHLNKIMKIMKNILIEQKDDTPSASNPANGMTLNDVGLAQKTSYNSNNETTADQEFNVNTFLMSNPFSTITGDKPQSNTMFPTYGSDNSFKSNWSQSDELNPCVQVPPSSTASATSTFINHVSPTSVFLPKTNQNDENVPLMTPVSSTVPTNTSIFNNFSELLDNMTTQFSSMLKDTNPFKFTINGMQTQETQNEQTANNYNADTTSYLSTKSPQNNALKTETVNIHTKNNCFTPASNLKYVSENYTPRIIYESGPVMYNTQKKQIDADANARQNACSSNFDSVQNAQNAFELEQRGKKPASQVSQPAKDIVNSHMPHKVINHIKKDNSQIDSNYVTRQSTYFTQGSHPTINDESTYYQQNGNADNLRFVSTWNQTKIPEHWTNSKFQNVSLLNHSENTTLSNHSENTTPITLSHQDWNYGRKSQEMNEAIDMSNVLKINDDHDNERSKDIDKNFWHNTENGSVQNMNAVYNSFFVFQKIDSVKGVTFIFNFEQDGWILTYEFVEAFTNLQLYSRLLAILEILNIKVIFKEILRSQYPIQFSQLDRYPLNVPRDSEKRIISINLISLQTALALLHKLKIISREEIENAFKKNEFLEDSVLPTLWTLIVTYRDLKQRIELCSNYI